MKIHTKLLPIILFLFVQSTFAMDSLVISTSCAKTYSFITSEGLKKWDTASYSKQTSSAIKQMLSQIKVSNICDVTAIMLTPGLIVRDRKEVKRTEIDPETFIEKETIYYTDGDISHRMIEIIVRVGKKNQRYNTSDFPVQLQKDMYKMWLRFEAGNP